MAHYAKVLGGKVIDIMVAEEEFFETFVDSSPGTWIQTSYNTRGGVHYGQDGEPDGGTALRKNYAGIGMLYDSERDAFYAPQPHNSWVLNEDSCIWEAPIPEPDPARGVDFYYSWDEDAYQADNTTGWVRVEVSDGS